MKIYKLINLEEPVQGEVGIELEVEGYDLPTDDLPNAWKCVEEGSLRDGGVEYVCKKPLPRRTYKSHIEKLKDSLSGASVRFSDRTSTHVHINISDMEEQALQAFIALFCIYEHALVKFCGPSREGNAFCLRTTDAEYFYSGVKDIYRRAYYNLESDYFKYCAINIASIERYGSLEFRSMRGTLREEVLHTWIDGLLAMKDLAIKLGSASKVLDYISTGNVIKIGEKMFGTAVPFRKCRIEIFKALANTSFYFKGMPEVREERLSNNPFLNILNSVRETSDDF